MKVKADLHNHLRTSSRIEKGDFNKVADIASSRLGSGGVLGIVNFSDRRYENLIDLPGYERVYLGEDRNGVYIPEKDVFFVKGQEIPTREGHLLSIGGEYRTHLSEGKDLCDTLYYSNVSGNVSIADHPLSRLGIGDSLKPDSKLGKTLIKRLDAIEIHNGETSFSFNSLERAFSLYKLLTSVNPYLGAISSSDGHSFYEIGTNWTEIERPEIWSDFRFNRSLKEAISSTHENTNRKINHSLIGVLDHMTDILFITRIAFRLGLRDYFLTKDRP